jgi:hypothetical protein
MPIPVITNNSVGANIFTAKITGLNTPRDVAYNAANGYLFVADTNNNLIKLFRVTPGSISSTSTPAATFTASGVRRIKFFENGANSFLFAACAGSNNVAFWRFNPATISSTNTPPLHTFASGTFPTSIDFSFQGSTSILITGNDPFGNATALVWIFDPLAATITPTQTLGVTSFRIQDISFYFNGPSSYLLIAEDGQGRARFWRFDPYSSGTIATATATFLYSNSVNECQLVRASDTEFYAITSPNETNLSAALWRFNPSTVSGSPATTATFNCNGRPPRQAKLFLNGANSLLACSIVSISSVNQVAVFKLNPATVSSSQNPLVIYNVTGAPQGIDINIASSYIDLFACEGNSVTYQKTDLNIRSITATVTTENSLSAIYKVVGGVLTLAQSIPSLDFLSLMRSGATQTASGFGVSGSIITFGYAVTNTGDSAISLAESFARTGSTVITDPNFSISMASGTVQTLGSAGTYDEPWDMLSGSILEITQNTILTSKFVLRPGVTVRSVGGAFALTIPYADPGVTLTGGATLITPQIRVVAANFADGVRAQVSHRQIFTIASTAINTTTDVLTLGNDSNGDAANFRTSSPNTLVRFSLSSGATMPTSSPQIIDGGLYYWKSGGQLSIVEGGTAINFSTQGSGNFVLVAETEINNAAVSGGAGYSFTLTRSNNAQIRVKAAHWSELSGNASSSKFYDQVFAWSSTAGISILDTVSNAVVASKDAIHEQIVALSSLPLEGTIKDATGAIITSITPANSGAAVTGLALALEGVGKIQMNATDVDGILAWQDLYLWGCYVRATEAGIRLASGSTFSASNIFNYVMSNLEFDNPSSTTLAVVGGVGTSADGSSLVSSTTTGSIILNALSQGTGAIVSVSGSGSFNPATDPVIVGSIQANAITPNAIAANAITAAKIAPDALTEIRKDPRPTIETN